MAPNEVSIKPKHFKVIIRLEGNDDIELEVRELLLLLLFIVIINKIMLLFIIYMIYICRYLTPIHLKTLKI
jgi:hypothetical protein